MSRRYLFIILVYFSLFHQECRGQAFSGGFDPNVEGIFYLVAVAVSVPTMLIIGDEFFLGPSFPIHSSFETKEVSIDRIDESKFRLNYGLSLAMRKQFGLNSLEIGYRALIGNRQSVSRDLQDPIVYYAIDDNFSIFGFHLAYLFRLFPGKLHEKSFLHIGPMLMGNLHSGVNHFEAPKYLSKGVSIGLVSSYSYQFSNTFRTELRYELSPRSNQIQLGLCWVLKKSRENL